MKRFRHRQSDALIENKFTANFRRQCLVPDVKRLILATVNERRGPPDGVTDISTLKEGPNGFLPGEEKSNLISAPINRSEFL